MPRYNAKICVYYDGACPKCIKDRQTYEKLAGKTGVDICWIDITGRERQLRELGIDPHKALTELHVRDEKGTILAEIDAYILLMRKVPLLRPIAGFAKADAYKRQEGLYRPAVSPRPIAVP